MMTSSNTCSHALLSGHTPARTRAGAFPGQIAYVSSRRCGNPDVARWPMSPYAAIKPGFQRRRSARINKQNNQTSSMRTGASWRFSNYRQLPKHTRSAVVPPHVRSIAGLACQSRIESALDPEATARPLRFVVLELPLQSASRLPAAAFCNIFLLSCCQLCFSSARPNQLCG